MGDDVMYVTHLLRNADEICKFSEDLEYYVQVWCPYLAKDIDMHT